jgi:UrcA family protein
VHSLTISIMISISALAVICLAPGERATPQVVVQFGDLDLAKLEDAGALYHRLHTAAEVVCGPPVEPGSPRAAAFGKCIQSALASAVMRVDQEKLTSYYRAHGLPRNPLTPSQV